MYQTAKIKQKKAISVLLNKKGKDNEQETMVKTKKQRNWR